MRELLQALSAPDLSTPAGVTAFERLTTLEGRNRIRSPGKFPKK